MSNPINPDQILKSPQVERQFGKDQDLKVVSDKKVTTFGGPHYSSQERHVTVVNTTGLLTSKKARRGFLATMRLIFKFALFPISLSGLAIAKSIQKAKGWDSSAYSRFFHNAKPITKSGEGDYSALGMAALKVTGFVLATVFTAGILPAYAAVTRYQRSRDPENNGKTGIWEALTRFDSTYVARMELTPEEQIKHKEKMEQKAVDTGVDPTNEASVALHLQKAMADQKLDASCWDNGWATFIENDTVYMGKYKEASLEEWIKMRCDDLEQEIRFNKIALRPHEKKVQQAELKLRENEAKLTELETKMTSLREELETLEPRILEIDPNESIQETDLDNLEVDPQKKEELEASIATTKQEITQLRKSNVLLQEEITASKGAEPEREKKIEHAQQQLEKYKEALDPKNENYELYREELETSFEKQKSAGKYPYIIDKSTVASYCPSKYKNGKWETLPKDDLAKWSRQTAANLDDILKDTQNSFAELVQNNPKRFIKDARLSDIQKLQTELNSMDDQDITMDVVEKLVQGEIDESLLDIELSEKQRETLEKIQEYDKALAGDKDSLEKVKREFVALAKKAYAGPPPYLYLDPVTGKGAVYFSLGRDSDTGRLKFNPFYSGVGCTGIRFKLKKDKAEKTKKIWEDKKDEKQKFAKPSHTPDLGGHMPGQI